MAASMVRSELSGGVARLQLDSPANRNALSETMLADLVREIQRAAADPEVRVLVLGHTGPTFCSGADLREQTAGLKEGRGAPGVGALAPLFQLILDCPKPVVGAVGGAARAGGLGLVAACDIAIAAESATFATGEVRLGVAPAVLSVVVLPKVGRSAAARLFLTGATIGASEAQAMGLVAQVVGDAELAAAVELVVSQLLLAHPNALAATKRILAEVPTMPQATAFAAMVELSAGLFSSPEAHEGMMAFLERRAPSWSRPPDHA
ncbi:MAG TPA: enoyl-CoA hydratase-related protein [Candidatus Dormibacteraeota bacterium]|nr:enoyl-CoA hydratase-related protein [Candidatus Dormibacteraeota bacterium]